MICTSHQIITSPDQIKNNEMGGAYGLYGIQKKCMQGFSGEI